jgi:hypothetical protein
MQNSRDGFGPTTGPTDTEKYNEDDHYWDHPCHYTRNYTRADEDSQYADEIRMTPEELLQMEQECEAVMVRLLEDELEQEYQDQLEKQFAVQLKKQHDDDASSNFQESSVTQQCKICMTVSDQQIEDELEWDQQDHYDGRLYDKNDWLRLKKFDED